MKKVLFIIVLFTISISTSFSQTSSNELESDADFINYVTNFNKIVDHISVTFSKNMFSNLQSEIDNLKKQNLSKEDELKAVATILKHSDIVQLEIQFSNVLNSHAMLIKKYGAIKDDVFLISYKVVSSRMSSNIAEDGCRRPWRYLLCAGAVAVEGALILAACEAASGGVATPACLAASVTWAANGIADCRERYCDPLPE